MAVELVTRVVRVIDEPDATLVELVLTLVVNPPATYPTGVEAGVGDGVAVRVGVGDGVSAEVTWKGVVALTPPALAVTEAAPAAVAGARNCAEKVLLALTEMVATGDEFPPQTTLPACRLGNALPLTVIIVPAGPDVGESVI